MNIRIVEVGPRDGLQNESAMLSVEDRLELIRLLTLAGSRHIEVGAFVSPAAVPRMQGSAEIVRALPRQPDVTYSVLVPNAKGMEAAIEAGSTEVAVFTAASETFSQRNTGCSVLEGLERARTVIEMARPLNIAVRGYVSCVLGCPFEGQISPHKAAAVVGALLEAGCYEVSLGDTLGVGTPHSTARLLEVCTASIPIARLAGHFHDTYGMAIANVAEALRHGMLTFDASVSGLGGCPYAPGAAGNVATEDLVYLLHNLGHNTGLSLDRLRVASEFICARLRRQTASRVARAMGVSSIA
jgi:isopropylmalate/homocitrate/citramalate synthase